MRSGALAAFIGEMPACALNPDEMVQELRPRMPGATEFEIVRSAQALSDSRVDAAIAEHRSLLVETVLSSDKFRARVTQALAGGFHFGFVYVTVRAAGLNVARVADRVAEGGHDVPTDRVLARRIRSHAAFPWFAARAHRGLLIDNTGGAVGPILVADKTEAQDRWNVHRTDLYPELTHDL